MHTKQKCSYPIAQGNKAYDAVVVGSGPNGLAAAITCARAGRSVLVLELRNGIGGGVRSESLTLPGFTHDVCSAFYPLGIASPFFSSLPLANFDLEWIHPPAPLAHPFEDGTAVVVERSVGLTAQELGVDAKKYASLFAPLVRNSSALLSDVLAPPHLPKHPLTLARFGLHALHSAEGLAKSTFQTGSARALFVGLSAHSFQPLQAPGTAAFGLILGLLAHSAGWPIVKGGSQRLSDALGAYLRSLGGEIRTNSEIETIDALPSARAVFLDLTVRPALKFMGERWPAWYRKKLACFHYGPGAFKLDWALDGPIPWKNPSCARAGTVHLGGTFEEIAQAELAVSRGELPDNFFMLVGQQTLFDPSRAAAGGQTVWAYCHVPHGYTGDCRDRVEAQIERYAPGFKDRILACATTAPAALEAYNPNCVGGDIAGGASNLRQILARPVLRWNPYRTPAPGVYLCSASTPPGGGVHGLCGFYAACAALRRELR